MILNFSSFFHQCIKFLLQFSKWELILPLGKQKIRNIWIKQCVTILNAKLYPILDLGSLGWRIWMVLHNKFQSIRISVLSAQATRVCGSNPGGKNIFCQTVNFKVIYSKIECTMTKSQPGILQLMDAPGE